MQGKERGACFSALLASSSVVPGALGASGPGRLIFDPVQHLEGVTDRIGEARAGSCQRGIQLAASGLVMAVVNLIDHRTILFSKRAGSKSQREAVDAVVGGTERALDQCEAASIVEHTPGSGRGAAGVGFGDLLGRSIFDERTGAEAISHGESSFLLWAAGEGGWIGEGSSSPAVEEHVGFATSFRQ